MTRRPAGCAEFRRLSGGVRYGSRFAVNHADGRWASGNRTKCDVLEFGCRAQVPIDAGRNNTSTVVGREQNRSCRAVPAPVADLCELNSMDLRTPEPRGP
jgi:hypothetical protein